MIKKNLVGIAKKVYLILNRYRKGLSIDVSGKAAENLIAEGILSPNPFLCARLGCTESQTICFSRMASHFPGNILLHYFWNGIFENIHNSSGVFNADKDVINRFSQLYRDGLQYVDLFAAWHPSEAEFSRELSHCKHITLDDLGPSLDSETWTRSLKGKKILIVSPFTKTMQEQYKRRHSLFNGLEILPDFSKLLVLKAVQSAAGEIPKEYRTWFDALNHMKAEMDQLDFDVALIGAGAYGFPLGVHAKMALGKKAIIVGGKLQLLFGIMGKRWIETGLLERYKDNPYWIHPLPEETPSHIEKINGNYW